jgi:hypothetical protein
VVGEAWRHASYDSRRKPVIRPPGTVADARLFLQLQCAGVQSDASVAICTARCIQSLRNAWLAPLDQLTPDMHGAR